MQTLTTAFQFDASIARCALAVTLLLGSLPMRGSAQNFSVASPDVKNATVIPQTFAGCDQQFNNISPALTWSGAPEGTRSFVVTLATRKNDQVDFPNWQWLVYNIPAKETSLRRGAGSDASRGLPEPAMHGAPVSGGRPHGYYGPCPTGTETERYVFSVYALKVERVESLQGFTGYLSRKDLESMMIGKTSFTVLMKR